MILKIDGKQAEPKPGQSLLELVQELGLDGNELNERPLAAQMAGKVFTLNYIPVRLTDEGDFVRRAVAESGGEVTLCRYADAVGKECYIRSLKYVIFLAIHRLWPDSAAKVSCTLGNSLYISMEGAEDFSVDTLKKEIEDLIRQNIPFVRRRIPMQEAVSRFAQQGRKDKSRLLEWRSLNYFDEYAFEDFGDYFYGEMVPSTGYLTVWEILPADGGFVFLYPDDQNPKQTADFTAMPHFFEVFAEGERWCSLMNCENVADLNALTESGKIRELIRVNEALHEKRFSQAADLVCQRGAKLVMLAGPSSSGKTTSANRLATQLRVHGKTPLLMSLDDYYRDRDTILPGPDGTIDLEHINTIDTDLFREHMAQLLSGQEIPLPTFNFVTGKREWRGNTLKLDENSVMIVEGLHALNPVMLPEKLDHNLVFRLYVSPLLPLNLDNHNRIPTSSLRLLRRTVRDYETRDSSVHRTFSMWDSVRQGEARWIFPYQENADMIFNSSTLYELAVLKKHIYPLLIAVTPDDTCYDAVQNMVSILSYIREADVDDEIPPTSLVREFIGGNSFYR